MAVLAEAEEQVRAGAALHACKRSKRAPLVLLQCGVVQCSAELSCAAHRQEHSQGSAVQCS